MIAFLRIGTRARNIALPGVRRLRLGRIDDLHYHLVENAPDDWRYLRSGMPAAKASLQSDEPPNLEIRLSADRW
jgi:hypothetical protein